MATGNKIPHISADAQHEDELQYGHGPLSLEELEEKYPNRPHNHSKTFPFHVLYLNLFNPLNENRKNSNGPTVARAKVGPHGKKKPNAQDTRYKIIERFISRWRNDVGLDFFPAIRLIIPEKDRERPMYGLKEKAIGKIICKMLNLPATSEDGYNLTNWKLPGLNAASRMAGDFAGRCYEVLKKRQMRTSPGKLTIAEVNVMLDRLAAASKEDEQLPIFQEFYREMNAEEMLWLIRIILRQMKVGATEKTFLNEWHKDGEALFNVTSSLRRVCWELTDPNIHLEGGEAGISIMECFQPQLAQFQMYSFEKMVEKMQLGKDDDFWIEEKLDGERMQMHMVEDPKTPGGRRFAFWSRKAKDYTYLYGNGFEDDNSALTRHIKDAFNPNVRNIILDGEMITWDPEADIMVPFGTLKTAALSEQRNPFQSTGPRPLFRVFDCLYLNDEPITGYMLKDRRNALEKCVKDVHRRIEIHHYQSAKTANEIEPALRSIVAEASEGLVLKNPRSVYKLNDRNDAWLKVKPEYMEEYGESLDCVVIGGYYGSGHRGGRLATFLCGLRVDESIRRHNANPELTYSFFKVGGGFKAEDYANIMHQTEGKWIEWNQRNPPNDYIELGGHASNRQCEQPDVWIKPSDSVVLEVKAASVVVSDQFRIGLSLRFPRFKKVRPDKNWESALSVEGFMNLKSKAEKESQEKAFKVDESRKRNIAKKMKKEMHIAGNDIKLATPYAGPKTEVFEGLNFCVMTEMLDPVKKDKAEIVQAIKSNGGATWQTPAAKEDLIVISDKRVVKTASLIKSNITNIVKARWVFDCIHQAEIDIGKERFLVPLEPCHMLHTTPDAIEGVQSHVDGYGDSYTRDVDSKELKQVFEQMQFIKMEGFDYDGFLEEMETQDHTAKMDDLKGWLFRRCVVYIAPSSSRTSNLDRILVRNQLLFASAQVAEDIEDQRITHIVILDAQTEREAVKELRRHVVESGRRKLPRFVTSEWVQESWEEGTLLDEERFAVVV